MTTAPATYAYQNPGAQVEQLYQGNNQINHQIINVQNLGQFARQWTPPTPPACFFDAVARPHHAAAVIAELAARGSVAIGSKTRAVALQGMAGVGKTTLALLLAAQLQPNYPDGILWVDVGPAVTEAAHVQPILNQWAGYALAPLDRQQRLGLIFEPDAVRTLLADHPRLLVILDNVWSLPAITPLRRALPPGAHLLLTTRARTILRELGGGQVLIDTLSAAEAAELAALRLDWPDAPQQAWVQALIAGVGHHPLALDVALARLRREGDYPAEWQRTAERLVTAIQQGVGFGDLRLDEDDRERQVEAVLADSYQILAETAQSQWRSLGAFALDAPFTTPLAATLWQCDAETARRQLVAFANAALLTRLREEEWQQHGLLRGYALALAHAQGDAQTWAAAHAASYNDAMRQANDAQRHYELLPALPQLRHAMRWALAHDLPLAQDLIANSENLLAAFGFSPEGLAWCEAALAQAQATDDARLMARAYGSFGNVLSRVANLGGQARAARLHQSLAAYDEALRFRRPDTAPLAYAMTQNNRGTILSALANLPDEERSARLCEALAAYDEALRFRRPETAPLNYAMTQNNRGTILSALANLPDEARGARLREALAAYDEALRFRRPETAPLDYAMTQGNCGLLFQVLAEEPGEDRHQHLQAALQAMVTAWRLFVQMQHAPYQQQIIDLLCELRISCGDDFNALWQALNIGEPPDWLQT